MESTTNPTNEETGSAPPGTPATPPVNPGNVQTTTAQEKAATKPGKAAAAPKKAAKAVDENEAINRLNALDREPAELVNDRAKLAQFLKDRTEEDLLQLVGGTITHLVQGEKLDPTEPTIYGLAITIENGQHGRDEVIAWIQADPEGNGPGHLNIESQT